jgi:hypothetical protein
MINNNNLKMVSAKWNEKRWAREIFLPLFLINSDNCDDVTVT